jgi:glutathione S-transferase
MDPSDDPPVLWHFRVSHYNEKVRWGLDFKRWPHVRRTQIPGFHLPVARWISGQNLLPILRLQGRIVVGSNHILAELERLRPDPLLIPESSAMKQRALALQAHFDEQVAPDLRRLFWSTYINAPGACARMATDGADPTVTLLWRALFPVTRPLIRRNMQIVHPSVDETHARMCRHFDFLARAIGSSGYLVGDDFTIADLTAAAVMTAIVRPPEFPYPLPEPRPEAFVPQRNEGTAHEAFRWVETIYRRHRGSSYEIVAQQQVRALSKRSPRSWRAG